MNEQSANPPRKSAAPEPQNDASTGLPLLRSWPAVYAFVFGVFVAWVVLLALFTRAFA